MRDTDTHESDERTDEQKALREAVADVIAKAWDDEGSIIKGADAAIAVVLERAAEAAATCHVGWPMDGREQRNVCAAAIRALIPASGDATS